MTKKIITNSKKENIIHSHIIMFTDDILTRIINSENILLDGTFIYPKGYVQIITNNVL